MKIRFANRLGGAPGAVECLLLAAALLAAPASARATVLCGAKDRLTGGLREGTSLHVRSACRSTEVQASLADLGLSAQPKLTVRTGNTISTNGSLSTPSVCEPGEIATGGGVLATGTGGGLPVMRSSRPEPETEGSIPTSWRVTVANSEATGSVTATAYAVCAAP